MQDRGGGRQRADYDGRLADDQEGHLFLPGRADERGGSDSHSQLLRVAQEPGYNRPGRLIKKWRTRASSSFEGRRKVSG
jgi:hypothetical protein